MLKIYRLLICFSIIWSSASGQNVVFEKTFRFEKGSRKINTIDVVGDLDSNTFALLLSSDAENTVLSLDSTFQNKGEVNLLNPSIRFKKLNGATTENGLYYVYFYNANTQTLLAQVFDPKLKTGHVQERQLDFEKRERILSSFSIGETFYILTLFENSSKLSVYEFKAQKPLKKTVFELNNADFPHYLSDNLYNCINHDKLRPTDANLVPDFVFSDKEDYIIYQDNAIYLISNTNTVIHINLDTKKHQVYQCPIDFAYAKKGFFLFKNVVKNTSIRSTIVDGLFFRFAEYESVITLQVFDLKTNTKRFDQSFDKEEVLKSYMSSDYKKEENLVKEDVVGNLIKGNVALRVYKDKGVYKINFGRNIDRLFELYYGYLEWEMNKELSDLTFQLTQKGDYHNIRVARQNMNYEYFEKLYRKQNQNLYLIQYDTKQRKLSIID